MRGKVYLTFDRTPEEFKDRCEATIRNVGRGTKTLTTQACEEILANSLLQVPRDTGTLADSAFYEVTRRSDTSVNTWAYEGTVGYGGNGNPVNPKTGKTSKSYMLEVHEDLTVKHKIGKAKFLEDPVNEYASKNFRRNIIETIRGALHT